MPHWPAGEAAPICHGERCTRRAIVYLGGRPLCHIHYIHNLNELNELGLTPRGLTEDAWNINGSEPLERRIREPVGPFEPGLTGTRESGLAGMRPAATGDTVAELIHKELSTLRDQQGRRFSAAVYGEPRDDGYWEGWLEFSQIGGELALRTDSETVQSSRDNLVSWALGLEPAYLEGAFRRSRARVVRDVAHDVHTDRLSP